MLQSADIQLQATMALSNGVKIMSQNITKPGVNCILGIGLHWKWVRLENLGFSCQKAIKNLTLLKLKLKMLLFLLQRAVHYFLYESNFLYVQNVG